MNSSGFFDFLVFLVILAVLIFIFIRYRQKQNEAAAKLIREDLLLPEITLEEQTNILNREIVTRVGHGWRVINQTPTTAQLTRDKKPSILVAIILLFLFIVPFLLYVLLFRGTENCYLEVNKKGRVIRHYSG